MIDKWQVEKPSFISWLKSIYTSECLDTDLLFPQAERIFASPLLPSPYVLLTCKKPISVKAPPLKKSCRNCFNSGNKSIPIVSWTYPNQLQWNSLFHILGRLWRYDSLTVGRRSSHCCVYLASSLQSLLKSHTGFDSNTWLYFPSHSQVAQGQTQKAEQESLFKHEWSRSGGMHL